MIGVIPVVGEFAAAQQPVIVVLNEGTMMTIQAVVSDDRRYVRLTLVPFFTQDRRRAGVHVRRLVVDDQLQRLPPTTTTTARTNRKKEPTT